MNKQVTCRECPLRKFIALDDNGNSIWGCRAKTDEDIEFMENHCGRTQEDLNN